MKRFLITHPVALVGVFVLTVLISLQIRTQEQPPVITSAVATAAPTPVVAPAQAATQPVAVATTPQAPITTPVGPTGAAATPRTAPVTAPLTTPGPPVAPVTTPLLSSGLPAVQRSPAPSSSAAGIELPSSLTPTTLSPLPTAANRSVAPQPSLPEVPVMPLTTDLAGAVGVTPIVNAQPAGISPAFAVAPGTAPEAISLPQTEVAVPPTLPVLTEQTVLTTAPVTTVNTTPATTITQVQTEARSPLNAPQPQTRSTIVSTPQATRATPLATPAPVAPAGTTVTTTTVTTQTTPAQATPASTRTATPTNQTAQASPAPAPTPSRPPLQAATPPGAPAPAGVPNRKREVTTSTGSTKRAKRSRRRSSTIDFTFENAPLTEAINRIAQARNRDILLPQGAHEIRQKITFKPGKKLTLAQAEEYLYLFLDLAGYTIRPGEDFEVVIKNEAATKSPLNLYIFDANTIGGGYIENLPNTDEVIRVVYYFANLKVESSADNPTNPIVTILSEILPTRNAVMVDPQSNGIVITEKSRLIRNVLELLKELDAAGSKHILATIQLYNTSAPYVADLIKNQIMATGGGAGGSPFGGGGSDKLAGVGTYFSNDIKIVPDERRNTLIIMGKEAPVNRLKDFIRESLDIPTQTGKSVFHVYDLKYLDSESFAPVLANVIQGGGLSGGSDNVSQQQVSGARRAFEGVVIKAETFKQVEAIQATQTADATQSDTVATPAGSVFRGGNRLLIAATPSDWEQIKRLIDELDIPQRQVIIEVMVIDYTRGISKALKSQVRNLQRMDFRDGLAFQAANMDNNIVVDPTVVDGLPLGIAGDLLRALNDDPTNPVTILSNAPVGTTAISINDPAGTGVWGVIELLDTIGKTKIITHPYVVALNNTLAQTTTVETIRAFADASSATGGAIVTNVGNFTATISIGIVPRISSQNRLNMEIAIRIEQFTDPNALSRQSRTIQTNINMNSPDQILVLGGLTRTTESIDETETPILGRIPLVGWLFRGADKTIQENELGIFIKPTIVEPRKRDAMNVFTKRKIETSTKDSGDDYLYGNGRDPIVRFFFKQGPREIETVNDYLGDVASAAENRTETGTGSKTVPIQERLRQEELEQEVSQTIPTEFLPAELRQGVS